MGNRIVEDSEIMPPLKSVMRIATAEDMKVVEENKKKEKDAFRICEEKIANHKLDMKLIDVECTFDNNKLLFYFSSENRVDFRELVKDLASVFRTRIELRQIGVRDEAKMLGGLGICGRAFCCKTFLGEFQPVSIKMAKEQGLSLNPTKISGTCGRLMCCLKYEQDSYEELLKVTPKVGAYVDTPSGKGYVEEVNLLTGMLKVKPENSEIPMFINKNEVSLIKDSVIKLNKEEINALKELEDK
jgi:cell fate regulator YaaT (PSP1 superfamily)